MSTVPFAFCLQIKTSWREVPSNSNAVNKLSPEVKDLLDKMFEVKQVSWVSWMSGQLG